MSLDKLGIEGQQNLLPCIEVGCKETAAQYIKYDFFCTVTANLTLCKRPGTSYRIEIHFAVFNVQ
jgi:hypothetical protein